VDTNRLRHANGTRPGLGQAIAIAEWPTESGPVDYALFVEGRCVGVIEAKRGIVDVSGRLGQAKRYARGIQLSADETLPSGPWTHGAEVFRIPFTFATNGRPYTRH
jgi:type I restriction enzyme R subunit